MLGAADSRRRRLSDAGKPRRPVTGSCLSNNNPFAPPPRIAGPLHSSENSSCLVDVLDCSPEGRRAHLAKHGKPAAIYLSVYEPLSAPVIRCPEAGSHAAGGAAQHEKLLVFHGAKCHMWRRDNWHDCYWNATFQARCAGPGSLRRASAAVV